MQIKQKIFLSVIIVLIVVIIIGGVCWHHESKNITENMSKSTTEGTIDKDVINKKENIVEIESDKEVDTNKAAAQPISLGKFKLTAYCSCVKCCGKHALNRPIDEHGNEIVYGSIGIRLEAGSSIAVDPQVIPYGEKVIINDSTYIAQDTGGAINGNRIDIYFDDHQKAKEFGVQYAEVFLIVN